MCTSKVDVIRFSLSPLLDCLHQYFSSPSLLNASITTLIITSWTEATDLASHLHLNLSHSLTNHNLALLTWRQLRSQLANNGCAFFIYICLSACSTATSLNSMVVGLVVMLYLYFFLKGNGISILSAEAVQWIYNITSCAQSRWCLDRPWSDLECVGWLRDAENIIIVLSLS